MSMFGSLMGDFDDDPIFGSHMRSIRHMSSMMTSLFSDPFNMMGQNALTDSSHRARGHEDLQMIPFGFPPMPHFNMNRLFADFDNMAANGNCHSFTTSSVMTMASGADGRPQVYHRTMSTTTAPGGVKETKNTVCDTRTGTKKMAIGHHIGDRAHILERERNLHNGDEEERQEFINLDEDEAESFNHEWETRTRRSGMGAIAGPNYGAHGGHNRSRPEPKQLALPDASGGRHSSHSRWAPSARRTIRPLPSSKASGLIPSSRHKSSGTPVTSSAKTSSSTVTSKNRKREHTPDTKVNNKRSAVSDSDI